MSRWSATRMPNWNDVLEEIRRYQGDNPERARNASDDIRRRYLKALHDKTGRNVIAYYSGFLSKPGIAGLDINDEDKNGYMMAVHRLDRSKGLDLILHTPGGNIAATQSIVDYLRKMFGLNIRAVIPQIAMSAGTMMACSCREIIMGTHSNIGPIDPHLRDIPTYRVIQEFRRAHREIARDPRRKDVWQMVISQYRPTFLSQCEDAIRWSNNFVTEQLETVMFAGQPDAHNRARSVVRSLTNYRGNRTHDRHIHSQEAKEMGLVVRQIEDEFDDEYQDLLLTVHHCYMLALMNSRSFKMIENHEGTAFVKQQQQATLMLPQPNPPPDPAV